MTASLIIDAELEELWPSIEPEMPWGHFLTNVMRKACSGSDILIPFMCNAAYCSHLKDILDVSTDNHMVRRHKFIEFTKQMFPANSLVKAFIDLLGLVSRSGYLGKVDLHKGNEVLLKAMAELPYDPSIKAFFTVRQSRTVSGAFSVDYVTLETGNISHIRTGSHETILDLISSLEKHGYVMVGSNGFC